VAQVLTPDSLTELQQLLGDELYPITQLFAEQLTHDAEALQQLAQADDFAALAARAHAVKGSTGNMGASALAQLAAQMEQAAKQQDGARAGACSRTCRCWWSKPSRRSKTPASCGPEATPTGASPAMIS